MASSSSVPTSPISPSPSSSAIPIIRPGKSILKRPPPPQRGFFSLSTLSKLLPSNSGPAGPNVSSDNKDSPLKRAHFILPSMSTVYPFSSANPPHTPNIKEEKRSVEMREAERRARIVRSNSFGPVGKEEDEWWSMDKVVTFYTECCVSREESANSTVSEALRHAGKTSPRSLDLSGIQLTCHAAAALSDILTVEWGLRKLVLRECDLSDATLKPILHSLLITNTLLFLSIASNRVMKVSSFKLIGAYISKAKTIQYLDLSQNVLDKKSVEYIVSSLGTAPPQTQPNSSQSEHLSDLNLLVGRSPSSLLSLRLDDCSLRPATLEVLAHAVRTSPLRNISLRHNRISATGAVALALMIKDYPDSVPNAIIGTPSSPSPSPLSPAPTSPTTPVYPTAQPLSPLSPVRSGPIPPPPRHPIAVAQSTPPQTTYTPYIPKSRRNAAATVKGVSNPQSPPPPFHLSQPPTGRTSTNALPFGETVPLITSSAQGGITTRHPPAPRPTVPSHLTVGGTVTKNTGYDQGPSAALLDKVRALDNLPRLGALRTLDLRGNDIRAGITYIAQVLKRNRTLKLLNLSENKIDVSGLVHLAEALKYNSCLETLDLSKNPCCGPGLEGIQSLRTAFTLNTSLKRLFLSSTGLTSTGAIALAEFLPESTSLLHLDLTLNELDHAGVLALSVGLKSNFVMRCLDLNIPAANEEMARLSREILSCCVRNTEEAEKYSRVAGSDEPSGRGAGKGLWSMIEGSELAKSVNNSKELKNEVDVVLEARECKTQLEGILSRTPSSSSPITTIKLSDADLHITRRAKSIIPLLISLIENATDPAQMDAMLGLNDALTTLLEAISPPPDPPWEDLAKKDLEGSLSPQSSGTNSLGLENGHPNGSPILTLAVESKVEKAESEGESEPEPFSSKVDKGKGKATEQASPVLEKLIMGGHFSITDSDDEDEERRRQAEEELMMLNGVSEEDRPPPISPTDRSRSWVEEEGEIFRKGQALLSEEEMESEFAGEELRQGLLIAEVERPPARQLTVEDMFDDTLIGEGPLRQVVAEPESDTAKSPTSPVVPRAPYIVRQRSVSQDSIKG